MSTTKYIVKLYPHDKFFFGGENTFGFGHQADYLVKSNHFPQQTGVLGFVRHQLLLQSNNHNIFKDNKIQDADKAKALIGPRGFVVNNGKSDYGAIKKISPVFIAKENTFYFPANKEYQIYTKIEKDCSKKKVDVFLEVEKNKDNILLMEYNAKFPIPDLMVDKSCNNRLFYDDIFIEHKQVGIRKNYEGGTDNDAYYVQTFYKFHKGFGFAFIVELEDIVSFNGTNIKVNFDSMDIAIFGGEQQTFKMVVEKFNSDFDNIIPDYHPSENMNKIVLVSDAYVKEDITGISSFAITEVIDFRFITLDTDPNVNYYQKPAKSHKFNLYKKGSVFYYENDQQRGDLLQALNIDNFRNIGYNYYKVITKNS